MRPTRRPGADRILPELWVGEFPLPTDAAWLVEERHVTAVVNLQDDGDLRAKGLDLSDLEQAYRAVGIRFDRIAIPDGEDAAMQVQVPRAAAVVDARVREGCHVYLHCNAGMNRAPTVAIAYLHLFRGFGLPQARRMVLERRISLPYDAILRSLAR